MSKHNTIKNENIETTVQPSVESEVIITEEPTLVVESTKEVVEPIATEEKPKSKEKYNKNIDFEGRGFSSFEEAISFLETPYFKGLGKEDQEEYENWLKK